MTYTQNHHLPQWVKSDQVKMEDFNAAMSSIESGLNTNAQAASAAQSTANSANSKATSAQTAANTAKSAAEAAYSPDNKPYVVGSYEGDGTSRYIKLGFEPSMVIVSGMTESQDASSTENIRYFAITRDNTNVRCRLQLGTNGFLVYPAGNYGYQTPDLSETGRHYDYIAFK